MVDRLNPHFLFFPIHERFANKIFSLVNTDAFDKKWYFTKKMKSKNKNENKRTQKIVLLKSYPKSIFF